MLSEQQMYAAVYSGTDGNISWNLDTETGVLTLNGSGNGSMYDYGSIVIEGHFVSSAPWDAYYSSIKIVDIQPSVTSIGDYAFSGCSLKSVTIPDGVTSIGSHAFSYCRWLRSLTIPSSVSSIGDYAFAGCSDLKSITIPEGVTSIERCAFLALSQAFSIQSFFGVHSNRKFLLSA